MQTSQQNHLPTWLLAVLCLALVFSTFGSTPAFAQTPANIWSPPVNISNAGASTNPTIITDKDGITHATWFDEFAGGRYARLNTDGTWSSPVAAVTPYEEYTPRLIAGLDNQIFAFWIGGSGTLQFSRVMTNNFGMLNAWSGARTLMRSTLSFDVEMDATGVFHVVFITNEDAPNQPAGVYYMQSAPGGLSWIGVKSIYTSPYFRSLLPENAPDVSVIRLAKGEEEGKPGPIFLAWDDLSQRKVLLSRSVDGGAKWEPAQAVDQPEADSGSAAPSSVNMTTWNDELMLIWMKGDLSTGCMMSYQTTSGGGASWTSTRFIFSADTGCPSETAFLGGNSEFLLLQATINNQVYLAAWNGQDWSLPQAQSDISGVKDPATARTLTTGCRQLEYLPAENLLKAISCDIDGNRDIWYTNIELDSLDTWFSTGSAWAAPQQLNSITSTVSSLNLVADAEGNFFTLWVQPSPGTETTVGSNPFAAVMYSTWNGQSWSQPAQTFRPRGNGARDLSVNISPSGDLLAVWRGENPGQIFFSHASADRAFSSAEWFEIVGLPTPPGPCITPTVMAGANEEVYVTYVIPANEGQGVYLNHSTDKGRTWSEPVRIFDGQAAGWELVSKPTLHRTADGQLHAIWQRGSLLLQGQGLGLGYARSSDDGVTWSTPDLSIEGRVMWASLAGPEQGPLFRVWQETTNGVPAIISQTSADMGGTWDAPISITVSGEILGTPNLITDLDGTTHLLQMSRNYSGGVVLSHWIWYNNGWTAGEYLDIVQNINRSTSMISSSISSQKKLAVIYTADDTFTGGQSLQAVIGAGGGAAAAPTADPQPTTVAQEPAQPDPTSADPTTAINTSPTPAPSPTEPIPATATPDLMQGGSLPSSSDNSWSGMILGSIFAVLIVAIVFGYRIMQSRRRGGFNR